MFFFSSFWSVQYSRSNVVGPIVLNCVNIRLNATTIAFLLGHSQSAVLMVDQEFFTLAEESLRLMEEKSGSSFKRPLLIVIGDHTCPPESLNRALSKGDIEYEDFLETGDPNYSWQTLADEWQSIALGYTSGTTASPKGVVLHHQGAYLMALSTPLVWEMQEGSVYLWTLPMFHCNGWCFTWSLAALSGTSICLRQVALDSLNFHLRERTYSDDLSKFMVSGHGEGSVFKHRQV